MTMPAPMTTSSCISVIDDYDDDDDEFDDIDDDDDDDDVDNKFIRGKLYCFLDGTDIIDLVIDPTLATGQTDVHQDEVEIVFDYEGDEEEEDRVKDGNDKNTTVILMSAPQQQQYELIPSI